MCGFEEEGFMCNPPFFSYENIRKRGLEPLSPPTHCCFPYKSYVGGFSGECCLLLGFDDWVGGWMGRLIIDNNGVGAGNWISFEREGKGI